MQEKLFSLIEKLENTRSLTIDEYEFLIKNRDESCMKVLREKADSIRKSIYGKNIYIRGLIEISNNCKNDCYYCGIRRSNNKIKRYRLSPEEIIACTDSGYQMGFRTFVLQGGEDSYFSDQILCPLIKEIKTRHPDCAVTLSLGERSFESYAELKKAGADRYLLREETYDYSHYRKLHPESMDFENRIQCLKNLKDL
ncbi:MAG: [FeFe] hydrogenase H-cluster radical SAM maturase HydE, partial [Treponemataceae bacterium]|nr:[FeFe] hydrogenase H-cluster radical SAM maturase HydE [Treponemataceae bacterium]